MNTLRRLAPLLAALLGLLPAAARAQAYRFPTSAEDYGAFYPTAYVDHGGTVDWNCGDLTYSGHRGSDFGGGSWTGMDEGRDIVAAAPGTVTESHDGEYDRCSTGDCSGGGGYGNYVRIAHADGKTTTYGHLKQWSVAVGTGQTVACGQKLGEMGSSGYSTGPHVHFEVREASNSSSDPFDGPCSAPPVYWVDQGAYGALPALVCDDVSPCTVVSRLSCGAALSLSNDMGGSSTEHGAYGSCSEYTYSGPEIAVELATDRDETVTVRMTGLGADLDLMLLGSEACDGTGCLATSANPYGNDEALAFSAAANTRYVVVVDGWEGAVSSFTLTAECAGRWPGSDTGEPPDTGDSGADSATDSGDSGPTDSRPPDETGALGDLPGAPVEPGAVQAACGCGLSLAPDGFTITGGVVLLLSLGALGWARRRVPSPR